jgi:hypothetical protein
VTWTAAETNTHQDHVIAHVIGATPLGHFLWDETAYLLLDIGFIWNIYLDCEMGLVPQALTATELDADDETKSELRTDIDSLTQGKPATLSRMVRMNPVGPIESIEFFESDDGRRLVLTCEHGNVVIETSLSHRWTRIEAELR